MQLSLCVGRRVLQYQQWWGTLTPESLQYPTYAPVPKWKPQDDYSHFFMRFQKSNLDVSLLAVAELRWLASGGILSMDSNVNIRAYDARIRAQNPQKTSGRRTRRMVSLPAAELEARNRASRVVSIPPTQESVDLLTCLEEWNNNQLPEELKKRTGGLTKKLEDRQFPKVLLHVLVEYMLATCVQLVLSSTCPHLEERCHCGLTRRF